MPLPDIILNAIKYIKGKECITDFKLDEYWNAVDEIDEDDYTPWKIMETNLQNNIKKYDELINGYTENIQADINRFISLCLILKKINEEDEKAYFNIHNLIDENITQLDNITARSETYLNGIINVYSSFGFTFTPISYYELKDGWDYYVSHTKILYDIYDHIIVS